MSQPHNQPRSPAEDRENALYHLGRSAGIMAAVAKAVDDNGDPNLPIDTFSAAFRQAEIHALIGQGYAALYNGIGGR
jgi:hypothetical protein